MKRNSIIAGLLASLLLISLATALTAKEPSTIADRNKYVTMYVPPIYRGDNGVADIHIHLLSTAKGIPISTPIRVSIIPISSKGDMKRMNFREIDTQDNSIHIRTFSMPHCKNAEITVYFPDDKVTGQARVKQAPKPNPEKVIDISSTESTETPTSIWTISTTPPYPDGGSYADYGDASIDIDTGYGNIYCPAIPYKTSHASCRVDNLENDWYYTGLYGLGVRQVGVTIQDGNSWNDAYASVTMYAFEYDENWNYVGSNYKRIWYIHGSDNDIDADIDGGEWVSWNSDHYYHGQSRVGGYASSGPTPETGSWMHLPNIHFDYIYWLGGL